MPIKKKKTKKQKKTNTDNVANSRLSWIFYILLLIGLLQVYSSSSIFALEKYGDSWFFIKRQLAFVILAGFSFWLSKFISLKNYLLLGGGLFIASLIGLILTHVPAFGVTVGGATRWLQVISNFKIEPGEFYKIGFGFFIYWILLINDKYKTVSFWWPFGLGLLISIALYLKQPDFGSVILLTLSSLVLLFLLIKTIKPFLILASISIMGLIFFLTQESYRLERFFIFLNPWKDPQGKGFQTIQSFVAFKKGGLFGEGIGMSQAKFFFLPEAHTDFTLAVFAEEFGFLGIFVLLFIFTLLTFEILKIIKLKSPNPKILFLGYYLASLFFFCFFINVCVNTGLVPTKGLPLPFLSYGGSSLLSTTILLSFFRSLEKSN